MPRGPTGVSSIRGALGAGTRHPEGEDDDAIVRGVERHAREGRYSRIGDNGKIAVSGLENRNGRPRERAAVTCNTVVIGHEP